MRNKITPVRAIRKKCLDCAENMEDIKNCECFENDGAIEKCFLYPCRMGRRPKTKSEYTSVKSIRKHCLWCCCGSFNLVNDCPVTNCPLWIYRLGKNPARKGLGGTFKTPLQSKKVAVQSVVFNEKRGMHTNPLTCGKLNGKTAAIF